MPARPEKRATGDAAEAAARTRLEAAGLRTLARNVSYRFGELDLVMRDGDTTVFVEVRFRASDRFGGALGSVTRQKRRRIALAANAWLASRPALAGGPCRFDVVVASPGDGGLATRWVRNAFGLGDCY